MQQLKARSTSCSARSARKWRACASVKAEYDAARRRSQDAEGQIASHCATRHWTSTAAASVQHPQAEVDTNRQLYDGLLQRYKGKSAWPATCAPTTSRSSTAPKCRWRFKPNLTLNLAIGLLLGGMLGVLAAFLLEFLDDTIKTPDDVEQKLAGRAGHHPQASGRKTSPASPAIRAPSFSEAYRSVRTVLQFATDHGVPRTLLVTSPGSGEGKSTTAMALARNFAHLGKRVLLIEADLRNPSCIAAWA